jgi:2-C-methyl-D-erythritol 4-phosphate cytidylyltransferase
MDNNLYVSAIIVAGGNGRRFGGTTKKQFIEICGKPILYHSIDAFEKCKLVSEIVLVLPAENLEFYERTISKIKRFKKIQKTVKGGKKRQDSVYNGLKNVSDKADIVLVHDAARPLVNIKIINRVIDQSKKSGCAICAVRINDTVKQSSGDYLIEKTIPRDDLWLAQTPQGFKYDLIKSAFQNAYEKNLVGTDESSFVESLGIKPAIVEGPKYNIKITKPEDLKLAEFYLKEEINV